MIPSTFLDHTALESFSKGTLTVLVDSSAHLYELRTLLLSGLQQHLDKCPDCACLAQADRRLDETLGKVMRDVPVPAGLKQSVMKRLATQRRP